MKWIGLTGGIATGKTSVKTLIEGLGFPVIDADQISHQITRFGQQGYDLIVSQFGTEYLLPNAELDRKKLGALIFQNSEERHKLESLLHPIIQSEVQRLKQEAKEAGKKLCFYDVPLLFEKNLQNQFDSVVVVWCDPATQLQRLVARNKLSVNEALDRIRSQLPLSEKISKAQHCIDNSGPESALIQLVNNLVQQLAT